MVDNEDDNFLSFYDSRPKFGKSSGKIVDYSGSSKWSTIVLSETPTKILFQITGSITSVQEAASKIGSENEHHRANYFNIATSAQICDRFMQTCNSEIRVSFGRKLTYRNNFRTNLS